MRACVRAQCYILKQLLNFRKQPNEYEHFENGFAHTINCLFAKEKS